MSTTGVELARLALQSLPAKDRAALLRELSGEPAAAPTDRLLRRAEVARRLGRTVRAVDMLGKQGVLHRLRLPGRTRAAGFRESDIVALIEGRLPPAPTHEAK